ncbi:MAG: insulinase family protein [bacterium]|nr:insulinase family protein [bacterium]MDE0669055.1 insulinase family protein [bacterium]
MRRLIFVILGAALIAAACAGEDSPEAAAPPPAAVDPAPVPLSEPTGEPPPPPEPPQPTTDEAPVEESAAEAPVEPPAPPPAAEVPADEALSEEESIAEPVEEAPVDAEPPAEEPIAEPVEEQSAEAPVDESVAEAAASLPVDPEVLIGTLDNGLTYYIRNNEEPGSNLSLRLAVDAGAVNEPAPGLGIAHFLEHMMFNGTEDYPRNDIVEALRELGVEFGPDINAYTSYDETLYMLDVVTTQAGAIETAFNVLAQWAHAATIAEADVNEERGIVRDELRLNYETGDGIIRRIFDDTYVAGTPYAGYIPIGTAEGIESVNPEMLRDFYETWYVPSNMALIAVGDLPVAELEALTEEYFGPIPARAAPPEPDKFSPISPEPVYLIATSPSWAYSYVSLDLKIPAFERGTVEGERVQLLETLLARMLDARLKDAYEQGFLSQLDPAKWDPFSYTDGIRFYGTNLRAEDLAGALGDYWSMVLSLEADGFSAEDLQQAADLVRSELRFELDSVGTVQDHEWADLYAAHFLAGADIGTVADRLERVEALMAELTAADLTAYFGSIMAAAAPIVIAVGSDPSEVPAVEELRAAVESAAPGPVPERTAEISALMEPPEPVEPVTEGPLEAVDDAYEWVFANGASVVFVPSDISEAQVDMQAVSQGGWSTMAPGDRALAGRLATRAVLNSGLGGLGPSQVERLLEEQNAGVVAFIDETTEGFAGSAAVDGVETMFQMLHLLVTAPQVDDKAFAEALQVGDILISLAESDPDWMAWIASIEARHPDAFEWFNPVASPEALAALTPESLLDRYLERLGAVDDLLVAVAGDIDREAVAELARTYIGTLPAGEPDTYVNRRSDEPAGVVRREVVLPPDTQSTGVEFYFEAPLAEVNVALDVAAAALASILDARLVAEVREDIGASYSASGRVTPLLTPAPGVGGLVVASGDPQYIEQIQVTILAIAEDLATNGPSLDEWEEALAVLGAEYTHEANSDYLYAVLRRAYSPDEELPTTGRLVEELAELEIGDVQALAAALFDIDQRIEIITVLG